MLNHIWLYLIIIGIGAALFVDIKDGIQDKYKTNAEIKTTIIINRQSDIEKIKKEKKFTADIIFHKEELKEIYGIDIEKDYTAKSSIVYDEHRDKMTAYLEIEKNAPWIIKEIAKGSGKDNDITAEIKLSNQIDEKSYKANITFEKIRFVKMKEITSAVFDFARTAVNIALGLIGIMALWLGVMKVAEEAGLTQIIAKGVKPITKRLFPDVPTDHPAMSAMIMNISANMLGLSNAATPFGLKAMEELDKLNPNKGTATNAMCMFLAINTAGFMLIPATAIAVRASLNSADPTIIIGTTIFGSSCATLTGILSAKLFERFSSGKFSFKDWLKSSYKKIIASFLFLTISIIFLIYGGVSIFARAFSFIKPELFKSIIEVISILAIPFVIFSFLIYGYAKKVKVYEKFVDGAKEGFNVAVKIIPYLVAMLCAIAIFRVGGGMDFLTLILNPITSLIGMPSEVLPMALMRPLSGSGSLGIMSEIMTTFGPDSRIGIMASTYFGSSETTFYVLALYFGSVNITRTRYALPVGLLADAAGIIGATFIVNLLF